MTLAGNNVITLRKLTANVTAEKGIFPGLKLRYMAYFISADYYTLLFFFHHYSARYPQGYSLIIYSIDAILN